MGRKGSAIANCIRERSNWSKLSDVHRFDSAAFDAERVYADMPVAAPKLKALLDNIVALDEADVKEFGHTFKHFIYSDVKTPYGAKLITSGLAAYGFHHAYGLSETKRGRSFVLKPPRVDSFATMTTVAFFQKPVGINFRKEILKRFNARPSNVWGLDLRIIVLDSGLREGVDLFDVKYVHLFEPILTANDEKQAVGRATRFCGQRGLEFDNGWPLQVFRYDTEELYDLFLQHSNIDMKKVALAKELESVVIGAAVDRVLTGAFREADEGQHGGMTPAEARKFYADKNRAPFIKAREQEEARRRAAFEERQARMRAELERRQASAERRRRIEEIEREIQRRLKEKAEEERRKIREEEERARRAEEERRRKMLSDARRAAEEERRRAASAERRAAEERRRKALSDARREAEERREAERRAAEEHRAAEERRRMREAEDRAVEEAWGDMERQRLRSAERARLREARRIEEEWAREEEGRKMSSERRARKAADREIEREWQEEEDRRLASEERAVRRAREAMERERQLRDGPRPPPPKPATVEELDEYVAKHYYPFVWPKSDGKNGCGGPNRAPRPKARTPSPSPSHHSPEKPPSPSHHSPERPPSPPPEPPKPPSPPRLPERPPSPPPKPEPPMKYGLEAEFERWEEAKKRMVGGATAVGGAVSVDFSPTQHFIRHYLTPASPYHGLLAFHSVGTGKTCLAIATATTTFEPAGWTILYVTKTSLKGDVWKNMFDQVCSVVLQKKMEAGIEMPTDAAARTRMLSASWRHIQPLSYRQFSNMLRGKSALSSKLRAVNPGADPLKRTLVIIDEAHKLFASDMPPAEKMDIKAVRAAFTKSYQTSGADAVKLLLMTGTPYTDDAMDMIRLLNLLLDPGNQLPADFDAFAAAYLGADGTFTADGRARFSNHIAGLVSYLNREKDKRTFAYPIFHSVRVPMAPLQSALDEEKLTKLAQAIADVEAEVVEAKAKGAAAEAEVAAEMDNVLRMMDMCKDVKGRAAKCRSESRKVKDATAREAQEKACLKAARAAAVAKCEEGQAAAGASRDDCTLYYNEDCDSFKDWIKKVKEAAAEEKKARKELVAEKEKKIKDINKDVRGQKTAAKNAATKSLSQRIAIAECLGKNEDATASVVDEAAKPAKAVPKKAKAPKA